MCAASAPNSVAPTPVAPTQAPIRVVPPAGVEEFLPYESHYVRVGGHTMHYLDEGSGPVVLLLHGNPTWCYYYRNLIRDLRSDFRVIAPDHLGCGLSDHPSDVHFRAVDRIGHLQELLKALNITRFSLVMHDWGGPIGTGLAVRIPEAIEKLVYLNTTLAETESLPAMIKTAAKPIIGRFLTKTTKRFLKLTTEFGVAKRLPRKVQQGYFFPYRTAAARTAIWDFVADIPFGDSHPSYGAMLEMAEGIPRLQQHPVKIIWGLRDPCFHREMLSHVARLFPSADVVEIPDASHLVLEDAPELANRTIRDFLLQPEDQVSATKLRTQATARRENGLYSALRRFGQSGSGFEQRDALITPTFLGDTIHYTHTSFRDLNRLINKYQRGLTELGLRKGDRVLMLVKPGVDFIALSYAIMGRGAIPVFVDPGMGKQNLFTVIREIAPDALIASPKAFALWIAKRSLFPTVRFALLANNWFRFRGQNLAYLKKFSAVPLPEVDMPEEGLIAFTSGGTGIPKGVIFTQSMLAEQLRIFRDVFGLEAGKKDLPLLPIFSIFTAALGVCSVFPPVNPSAPLQLDCSKVVPLINGMQIDTSFGSPTLWRTIAEYCVRSRETLPSIRRIFMAGAPVPLETIQRVHSITPNGESFTPYGSTEALPVTIVASREVVERERSGLPKARSGETGTFVGRAVAGVEIRIVSPVEDSSITDTTPPPELPPYEIGEVIVRGENVSRAYFRRPEADQASKVHDGESVWHRMGDLGYRDEEGNLYFCGRKAHMVRLGDARHFSIPVERIFNRHPRVKRSALIALHPQGGALEAALAVEPFPEFYPESIDARRAFSEELRSIGNQDPISRDIQKIFFFRSFPVDARHNAKIFRDRLGLMASAEIAQEKAA